MTSVFQLTNVSLTFPLGERPVLHDLTFSIEKGEFVILLGSNGCGKSSLLKLMDGALKPTKGRVKASFQRKAFLTQQAKENLFSDLTVLENCCLNDLKYEKVSFTCKTSEERAFYKDYLKAFHPRLPHKMDVPVNLLSGGECQALVLALALKHKPDVLFLDEHTSALDPKTAEEIMHLTQRAIQDSSITAVMTTHNLSYALAYGTRLIALKDGGIVLDVKGDEKRALTANDLGMIYTS